MLKINKWPFIFVLLLAIVFLSSCDFMSFDYVKLAHKIRAQVGRKIEAQEDIILVGTGGA